MSITEITNFYQQLKCHSNNRAHMESLVRGTTSLTYGRLFDQVSKIALHLSSLGISEFSKVGVSIKDEMQHIQVVLALFALGSTQVTLPCHDSQTSRISIANRIGVTHVVTNERSMALPGVALIEVPEWQYFLTQLINYSIPLTNRFGKILICTSGTTGDLNIIPFSEEMLIAQTRNCSGYENERLLRIASLEYNNSKRHHLYSLFLGGTSIFRDEHSVHLPRYCRELEVSCLEIPRIQAVNLLDGGSDQGWRFLEKTKIRLGGSVIPADLRLSFQEKISKNLYVRYGATECGTIAIAGPGQHQSESVGLPLKYNTVQIVDELRDLLPENVIGEVRIRTPGMATAYLDNPIQTKQRFVDGYFYPGDLGHFQSDGTLVITGRKDDMIIMNSINIFPGQIERVLDKHPSVKATAVCAVNSKIHGQIPVAAVELIEGANSDTSTLLQYCREHLSIRSPRKILIVKNLPRSPQGKILKKELLKLFMA